MRLQFNKFYSPTDSESGGGASGTAEESDTLELLSEEDLVEPEVLELDTPKKKSVDDDDDDSDAEAEDEVDELKEIEEELEGPKEEDLELTTPVRRKEILAKYPKLFKDFPYLEKAYYREQQFTETFPTLQDAKVASQKASYLDQLDREVMDGNITSVLKAAKSENQESFYKIADNYLGALRQVDQQAYFHVLGNVIKDTIVTMVREGRNLGDQGAPLEAAANVLNQFVFGSQKFTPPTQLSRPMNQDEQSRQERIRQEDNQRIQSQFEMTRVDLQTRADNVLKSTIDQHIDPNGNMTDYVKTHAVAEAHELLEDLLSKDTRFRGLIDRLWEKAFESKFDKTSTERIKAAYLSKAKTLLPSVIKKARGNALKGMGRNRAESDEINEPLVAKVDRSERRPTKVGNSTPPSSGKIRSAKDIPRGMRTLDVLMRD